MISRFEWDERKASKNIKKHKVSFEEAVTVFSDPLGRIFFDAGHSKNETREIIIGHSINNRLLLVNFIECVNSVRIFSARLATKKERKDYEENIYT